MICGVSRTSSISQADAACTSNCC